MMYGPYLKWGNLQPAVLVYQRVAIKKKNRANPFIITSNMLSLKFDPRNGSHFMHFMVAESILMNGD